MLIQKVLHLEDYLAKKSAKIDSDYAVMVKYNGWYVYIDNIDGNWGQLCSSNYRKIPSLTELSKKFQLVKTKLGALNFTNCRFIFEATIPFKPFKEINGILNRKYEQANAVQLNLHDIIHFNSLELAFRSRVIDLESTATISNEAGINTKAVKIEEVVSTCEAMYDNFNKFVALAEEGTIFKQLNAGYSPGKRNKTVLKLKEEITRDLLVTGIVEGKGKYENLVGSLTCFYKRKNIHISVSGFTDLERQLWWKHPALIVGKVIEVKAMSEFPNGSLKEPRFIRIRTDKLVGE